MKALIIAGFGLALSVASASAQTIYNNGCDVYTTGGSNSMSPPYGTANPLPLQDISSAFDHGIFDSSSDYAVGLGGQNAPCGNFEVYFYTGTSFTTTYPNDYIYGTINLNTTVLPNGINPKCVLTFGSTLDDYRDGYALAYWPAGWMATMDLGDITDYQSSKIAVFLYAPAGRGYDLATKSTYALSVTCPPEQKLTSPPSSD